MPSKIELRFSALDGREEAACLKDSLLIDFATVIQSFDYAEVRYFRMARTFLGRALYWTGVYFVDGLLVDSGPPNLAHEVARLCRELTVRQCVTTHHHEDHTGGHGLLREYLHITPLAHPRGVARIAQPDLHPQLYRMAAWGVPTPAHAQAVGDWLETGRFQFRVIYTPGHAEDHIVLWEPNRQWLFSGDLYLAPRLKYLRADEDVYALLDSLRQVVALEPLVLFCQHRGRVGNATVMLRQKLGSLVELEERIKDLYRRGLDEAQITQALPRSDLLWRLWTRGHFSKRNFVRAFLRSRRPPTG
ncbi:MAG TPA: MBL fold metallo-hydrolase [Candidatus Acidoferrales bacterium]|nr:MBL fold metallo-hydrolase [Candidatus Acidoferrales bacterium]